MVIGYLGPKATFTEQAVRTIFDGHAIKPFPSIPACIQGVEEGVITYGIVPIENTIEGSVTLTLDYLIHEYQLPIVGEIIVPIQQHLMIHPKNTKQSRIEKILSHPHALAQCRKYLHDSFSSVEQVEMLSTSAAARYVMENSEEAIGAIANELAAKEYGLQIIARNIHDYENNHTRFVIIQRANDEVKSIFKGEDYKTTLAITLPTDQPGALYQVLAAFAWRKLNLSKIESRPLKTGLGNYLFIIDVTESMNNILVNGAINELEALGCGVTCLGSYPVLTNKSSFV
ncbi:prephenate dehydratase [Bacillus salitolerans]|uniref:Prephenate dehydratase n=1 Tax=Bacillus salitolerans TaxID=1437434 RepID=A0ABW4LNG1_9BACI